MRKRLRGSPSPRRPALWQALLSENRAWCSNSTARQHALSQRRVPARRIEGQHTRPHAAHQPAYPPALHHSRHTRMQAHEPTHPGGSATPTMPSKGIVAYTQLQFTHAGLRRTTSDARRTPSVWYQVAGDSEREIQVPIATAQIQH